MTKHLQDWYTVDDCLYCAHCRAPMFSFDDLDEHLARWAHLPGGCSHVVIRPEQDEDFSP